jgi:hypothetical protein
MPIYRRSTTHVLAGSSDTTVFFFKTTITVVHVSNDSDGDTTVRAQLEYTTEQHNVRFKIEELHF